MDGVVHMSEVLPVVHDDDSSELELTSIDFSAVASVTGTSEVEDDEFLESLGLLSEGEKWT